MTPLIALAATVGLPLVLLTLLRIKPMYAFVSIVTGYFWVQYLGDSAELALRSFVHISSPGIVIRLVLLFLPLLLTLILMRKTLSASALPFQLILLLANSILIATFLIPLLSTGMQNSLYQTQVGNILRQSHNIIIATVAGLHLLVMYIMRPNKHDSPGHSKHHK